MRKVNWPVKYFLSYFDLGPPVLNAIWKNQTDYNWCLVQAIYKPPKAIRGDIPICFPQVYALKLFFFIFQLASSFLRNFSLNLQFGSHGSLEQHGFARNRFWSINTDPPPFPTKSKSFIDLILKPSEEDMPKWPHRWSHLISYPLVLYLAT